MLNPPFFLFLKQLIFQGHFTGSCKANPHLDRPWVISKPMPEQKLYTCPSWRCNFSPMKTPFQPSPGGVPLQSPGFSFSWGCSSWSSRRAQPVWARRCQSSPSGASCSGGSHDQVLVLVAQSFGQVYPQVSKIKKERHFLRPLYKIYIDNCLLTNLMHWKVQKLRIIQMQQPRNTYCPRLK